MSPALAITALTRRWVGWRAQRIQDPVARLRYLRAFAPASALPVRGDRIRNVGLTLVLLTGCAVLLAAGRSRPELGFIQPPVITPVPAPAKVWLVESSSGQEIYSNGLRIETRATVRSEPRSSWALQRGDLTRTSPVPDPAGIVFHTTESHMAAFDASENERLQRVGHWLLRYLQSQKSYHFLIDRFGRVHRVVAEPDAAYHAGNSVWADDRLVYANLNHNFLGVAFEMQTEPGEQAPAALTPAQVGSARMLTEWLRFRYGVRAENCVTHAQVSVNPSNHRIGNHTDWAANFPFAAVGLPDNYGLPVAAMTVFGFSYDEEFIRATGGPMWRGLSHSEELVRQQASLEGRSLAEYRTLRKQAYRKLLPPPGTMIAGTEVHRP